MIRIKNAEWGTNEQKANAQKNQREVNMKNLLI